MLPKYYERRPDIELPISALQKTPPVASDATGASQALARSMADAALVERERRKATRHPDANNFDSASIDLFDSAAISGHLASLSLR